MNFAVLAVIVLAGLVGPLLAYPRGWHVPVVLGELAMGILLGATGVGYLNSSDPTFTFLAGVSWLAVHGAAWETVAEPENLG